MPTTTSSDVAHTIAAAAFRDRPPERSRITHGANRAETTTATAIDAVTVQRRLARSQTTMMSPTTAVTRQASDARFASHGGTTVRVGRAAGGLVVAA